MRLRQRTLPGPRRILSTGFLLLIFVIGFGAVFAFGKIRPVQAAPAAILSPGVANFIELAKLLTSDGKNGDQFGSAVAISDDGSTMVVGALAAPAVSNGGQGAAYVFVRPAGGAWATSSTFAAKLTASDGIAGDYFGSAVSISGDGTTIVVGMRGATLIGGAGHVGKAYVFVKPAGAWATTTETARLINTDTWSNDGFALSVSLTGDGKTVVAGAPFSKVGSSGQQGATYVFVQPPGGWTNMTETARLTVSDGIPNDYFGSPASISRDGSTIVADAQPRPVNPFVGYGTAYVYLKPGGGWATTSTYAAQLTPSDGNNGLYFGNAVSTSTDGRVVVIGAPFADNGGPTTANPGAGYIFVRPGGGWATMTETAKLTASDQASGDYFGWAASISADGNTIALGAIYAMISDAYGQGAVYVFANPGSSWLSTATFDQKLTSTDTGFQVNYGSSVSLTGDATTLAVGAVGGRGSAGIPGAAFVSGQTINISSPGGLNER